MPKPTKIELPPVEFGDDPPSVPEGASRWEAQELRRCWHNALTYLRHTATAAAEMHARTMTATDPARPHIGGGGLTYHAMQADAALVEYHAIHNGVVHRLALAERERMGKA